MDKVSSESLKTYFMFRKILEESFSRVDAMGTGWGRTALGASASMHMLRHSVVPSLRDAKVFALPPRIYGSVWDKVNTKIASQAGCGDPSSTCECPQCAVSVPLSIQENKISLVPYFSHGPPGTHGDVDKNIEKLNSWLEDSWGTEQHWLRRPLPARPFPNMYLGYGSGLELGNDQYSARGERLGNKGAGEIPSITFRDVDLDFKDTTIYGARLMGHLITETGDVYEFLKYDMETPSMPFGRDSALATEFQKAIDMFPEESGEYGPLEKLFKQLCPHFPGVEEISIRKKSLIWDQGRTVLLLRKPAYAMHPLRVGTVNAEWAKVFGEEKLKDCVRDGVWDHPFSLSSYTVPALINLINENNKSFTLQDSYEKGLRRELTKKHKKNLPRRKKGRRGLPAYYVINVNLKELNRSISKAASDSTSSPRAGHKISYRHDRDAHERVHVRRGSLPLDPCEEDRLLMKGYTVYTEGQPLSDDQERLVRRRQPFRREGEWLAMRTSWVRSTVVGDEALPYKPAIRRLSLGIATELLK